MVRAEQLAGVVLDDLAGTSRESLYIVAAAHRELKRGLGDVMANGRVETHM
eukprot:SAG31_NODE_23396_length_505_cov_1.012315_1_plen_50_part_10